MSERVDVAAARADEAPAHRPAEAPSGGRRRRPGAGTIALLVVVALALVAPLYLQSFWLSTGVFAMAAIIGAIGLTVLTGVTGQLSLAHAFFLAVGAYGYIYFAADTQTRGVTKTYGLGLPPLLAMILAVLVAGLAGLLFSPIAARLRGIYLGVASLSLVFLGVHLLNNLKDVTGGFNGRSAPLFDLFGFSFGDDKPDLYVLNVPFDRLERLWYLALALAVCCFLFARNLVGGRPGRALRTVRDSEVAASVLGVNVTGYKARAFVFSSMYAGLAGVLLALAYQNPVPETFGLALSVSYLAMIVIGGIGSVGGAAIGAVFVTALPLWLQKNADTLPLLSGGGVKPSELANYLFGLAVVLVVLFEPGGLAAFGQRLARRGRRRGRAPDDAEPVSAGPMAGRPAG